MLRVILFILGILLYNTSFGQYNQQNTKTEEHIQIPGTKYFIVPPSGFVVAENFQGFQQNETGASIVVVDVPRKYKDVLNLFDKTTLGRQGIRMKNEKFFAINQKQAYLVTVEQIDNNREFTKQVLLLDVGESTYMINGMYLKTFQELNLPIRESLKTIVLDKKAIVDPYKGVNHRVNITGTKLILAKSVAGTLMYSVDGNMPPQGKDNTLFISGSSLLSGNEDKKQLFIDKFKELPYRDLEFDEKNIMPIEIDGVSGFELIAKGIHKANKGKKAPKELLYQVILFTDYTYYQMVGTSREDFFKSQLLFQKVANTFVKM